MSILAIQTAAPTGLADVNPEVIYIETNDTLSTVTTTGYLTNQKAQGFTFNNNQMALVSTSDEGVVWLKVEVTYSGSSVLNTVVSLVGTGSSGEIVLPTTANYLISSTDTTGTLSNITGTAINKGSIQAGLSGTSGRLISYSATVARGSLQIAAVANTGNSTTTISNAAMAQNSTISIPDPRQATSEFIIADSNGIQRITSGSLQVDEGSLNSGFTGGSTAGTLNLFPSATPGSLRFTATGISTGNRTITVTNTSQPASNQTVIIPATTTPTSHFITSQSTAAVECVVFTRVIDATAGQLSSGPITILGSPTGGATFRILDIQVLFSPGLSGGGGNRLLRVYGSVSGTSYSGSGITAALAGTPVLTPWGGSGNPLATGATLTSAGDTVALGYTGGTTNYLTGSIQIAVTFVQITA